MTMDEQVFIKGASYRLRVAQMADLPEIVRIYNQGVGSAHAYLAPVTVAERRAWFLSHSQTRPLLVLIDATGQMAAWVSLSDLYAAPAYHLSVEISLYVNDGHRGLGLGAYLLSVMLAQASDIGLMNVVAKIFAHNLPSLALFEKHGFETWGRLPQVCLSVHGPSDVVILGKALADKKTAAVKMGGFKLGV